jgi:hypothetical protein
MSTITQQQYKNLVERQEEVEREFNVLKNVLRQTVIEEELINPAILQKWDKISVRLDKGMGRSFSSFQKMRKWLTDL